jgi:cell division protein FtsN
MAQDYAKSRKAPSKAVKKKPARAATRHNPQDSHHWSWFFSGLFSGLLLCVIGYFTLRQLGENSPLVQDLTGDQAGENSATGTNLEFYDYLPQAEVEVNVVPVDIASTTEPEANPTTYLLQAGSFLDPNDAEALRARLILLNLETRIQPTNLSGRTWYRVQAGPFVGRARVEVAEKTMIEDNIDPIRMRVP